MKLASLLYTVGRKALKAARVAGDAEAIISGNPTRIARRAFSRIAYRYGWRGMNSVIQRARNSLWKKNQK